LTKFLKFYLKEGNSFLTFISCILPLDPFSRLSHDCLHSASLVENIFTSQKHISYAHTPGFKSKYKEIHSEIERMKEEIKHLDELSRNSRKDKYEINSQKADLGEKIDKLYRKILNSGIVRMQTLKLRASAMLDHEESGLFSINDCDISNGAFEIGNSIDFYYL